MCKSKKIVQLLQKIEDALLYDQEAFCAWTQTELFKEAYIKAFNRISWFRSYVYFQLAQGSIRLFKNKDSTMLENIPFLAQCYRSPLTDIPRQISIYTEMKNIIVKILPEAAHWPDEQLANYPYFCTCLKEKYGVDYSGSVIDAEPLFDLLEYAEKPDRFEDPDKFPYFPTIASADMTYNMISSICGTEADEIIFETLLGTVWYKRENTFLDTPRITDTWVYPIVEKWAYDKNHRLHKYAQRIIFDINTIY